MSTAIDAAVITLSYGRRSAPRRVWRHPDLMQRPLSLRLQRLGQRIEDVGRLVDQPRWIRSGDNSFDAHTRLCTGVGGENEDTRVFTRRREHHAFRQAELHFARCKLQDHRREMTDQLRRIVRGLGPGENGAVTGLAHVERELQAFCGAVDLLGVDDFRDARVDLGERRSRSCRFRPASGRSWCTDA